MNPKPLLAALLFGAAPLAAQHPGPPGHMMGDPMAMQEMMGPMMRVMLYTPQHLLARKNALGLSADQISRLSPQGHGEYTVTLRNGARLATSRTYAARLQSILK